MALANRAKRNDLVSQNALLHLAALCYRASGLKLMSHLDLRDMAKERNKRRLIVNPNEKKAGDFAYGLYNKVHPFHGDQDLVKQLKRQLKGLRGHRVKITIRGQREDDETGDAHRFSISRHVNYRKFWDVFGPGSAYASALHAYRDKHSEDALSVTHIDIEEVDLDEVEFDEETA